MSEHGRRGRTVRSFLFGGVVGGAIAVAAPRMRRRPPAGPERTAGLRAFEGAPCWHFDHGGSPASSDGYADGGSRHPADTEAR